MQPEFQSQDTPYSFQPTGNILKNDSKWTLLIFVTTIMIKNGGADAGEVKPCRLFDNTSNWVQLRMICLVNHFDFSANSTTHVQQCWLLSVISRKMPKTKALTMTVTFMRGGCHIKSQLARLVFWTCIAWLSPLSPLPTTDHSRMLRQ